MKSKLRIVNPLNQKNWDEKLLSMPGQTFFHTTMWARVLIESYGFTPCYFSSSHSGQFSILVPMMEVRSFITGVRGVSLPFSDYCPPFISEGFEPSDVFEIILDYGRSSGWKVTEIKSGERISKNLLTSSTFLGHRLDLNQTESELMAKFRSSTRRNIKKAVRKGVETRISYSADSLDEFYNLNCLTRKRHGLPPQPLFFFKRLYENVIKPKHGFVVLAGHEGRTLAASVFLAFGGKTIYKYGASNLDFQEYRANNLVMWEGIKWSIQNGHSEFCFGRTECENEGLRQFKIGWGSEEDHLYYHKFDFKKAAFVGESNGNQNPHSAILNKMPVSLLRLSGKLLYRHVA